MSPATTKKCTRCGEGFRGTMAPEEVHCAKCFVKTCEVPEDTDEQFLKLVSEAHGPELAMTNPQNTAALLPMMKDILNQKARLKMLEKDVEDNRYKSTKEKNRTKREIFRLREEKKEMDVMVDTIKAKMMHLVFIHPSQSKMTKSSNVTGKIMSSSPVSSLESSLHTPLQSPTSPRSPNVPRLTSTPASKAPNKVEKENTPKSPIDNNTSAETAPRPSLEKIEQQNDEPPPPNSPKRSPVKLAAAKFEEAAKKVNTMVTFAKLPTITKTAAPHPPKKEVNNNDTPVTASSSSEDDECEGKPSMLVRSNSVRDRIKAFEEIQRSASTGSYDRRKAHAAKGIGRRSLTSMKSINV